MSDRSLNQIFNQHNKKSRMSLLIASVGLLLFLVVSFTLPFNKGLFSQIFSRPNSHAAGALTAMMHLTPMTQSVVVNTPFTVSLSIDGGGQSFNAAAVTVATSSNLTVQNLSMGDCGFSFIPTSDTPTATKPSFQGAALLGSSSTGCTVYTLTLLPTSVGAATITLSGAQVLSSVDASNILMSADNGTYTITSGVTPTPTPIGKTATMNVSPSSGSHNVGDTFNVDLVINGGGQSFNAAAATVTPSSNLSIQSLTQGSCGFQYVPSSDTPTVTKPSFQGAVLLAGSSTGCTVYTLGLKAVAAGTGTLSLSGVQVLSNIDSSNILLSSQSGSYTLVGSTPVPTPTLTPAPTTTPTPTTTPAPVACTGATLTAQPTSTQVAGSSVALTASSTGCPNPQYEFTETKQGGSQVILAAYGVSKTFTWNTTGQTAGAYTLQVLVRDSSSTGAAQSTGNLSYTLTLPAITLGSYPKDTYSSIVTTNGTKSSLVTVLTLTDPSGTSITNGISGITSTAFTVNLPLSVFGVNAFILTGLDALSNKTPVINISINRHHLGDIDGIKDSQTNTPVGVADLALFALDYGKDATKTGVTLSNPLSDLNADNKVNLTDYSIFARQYGNPNPTI